MCGCIGERIDQHSHNSLKRQLNQPSYFLLIYSLLMTHTDIHFNRIHIKYETIQAVKDRIPLCTVQALDEIGCLYIYIYIYIYIEQDK